MKLHIRTAATVLFSSAVLFFAPAAEASLIFHSSLDDAAAIFQPEIAQGTYPTVGDAIPGPEATSYEAGAFGTATRFDNADFVIEWPLDGPIRFHGDNFDFGDPGQDGGRLDFWFKFNENLHTITSNTWMARTNWGERHLNFEWSSNGDDFASFMIDVYGDIPNSERTSYSKFRVFPFRWAAWDAIQPGEWHVLTFLWRHNGGVHKDEIHMFLDGTQAGCGTCSDYNGNLPPDGSVTDLFFSPDLYGNYLLFSVDEIYSFDSWDFGGIEGNFPDLVMPEGVALKYPQDNRYPTYGNPVPNGNMVFEFTMINDVNPDCDCDVYVDDVKVGTVGVTSLEHVEFTPPAPLGKGDHTWQVRCDGERVNSPIGHFNVQEDVPVPPKSFGKFKSGYRVERHN